MGCFKRAWTKYVGLTFIILFILTPSWNWFFNENYQFYLYPKNRKLTAWDFKFTFTVGKRNTKKYEVERKLVKPAPSMDLDCIRK